MNRAREKVPSMKQRSLSDKLAIENAVAPLEQLLNKQAQGELLVEHLDHTAEVVLASTSLQGQEIIRNENRALKENFERLFKGKFQHACGLFAVHKYHRRLTWEFRFSLCKSSHTKILQIKVDVEKPCRGCRA